MILYSIKATIFGPLIFHFSIISQFSKKKVRNKTLKLLKLFKIGPAEHNKSNAKCQTQGKSRVVIAILGKNITFWWP